MELDKLQIRLRHRTAWEAIDLGFAMARRWFLPLWGLWLSSAMPVALVLFLCFGDSLWLAGICLWWFKPIYEPTLVFWLSRAVFSETVPVRMVMKQWWRISRPQILVNLTFRRFNPSRSFTMPVALLEQLSGKPRRQRLRILGRNQHASAWLTIVGIHLESILQMAFIALLFFLVPEDLRWVSLEELYMGEGRIGDWLQITGSVLCMSLIAPFYVAAGFALYLHRRGELEGWDLEIAFRRMNDRYQKQASAGHRKQGAGTSVVLLSAVLLTGFLSQPVEAGHVDAEQSRTVIADVLADDAFGHYEQQAYWEYIGEEQERSADADWLPEILETLFEIFRGFLQGYAGVGKVIMWLAGIAIVVYLLYRISQNQGWFDGLGRHPNKRRTAQPVELFGLDLRPDSMPASPAEEATRLIEIGEHRAALSLLYRAALVRLITEHLIEIPGSATEGECVDLVRNYRGASEAGFFAELTGLWIGLAYGHRAPDTDELLNVCTQWQEIYGHVAD